MKVCVEIASLMYMFIELWTSKAEMDLRGDLVKPLNFRGKETEAQGAYIDCLYTWRSE